MKKIYFLKANFALVFDATTLSFRQFSRLFKLYSQKTRRSAGFRIFTLCSSTHHPISNNVHYVDNCVKSELHEYDINTFTGSAHP